MSLVRDYDEALCKVYDGVWYATDHMMAAERLRFQTGTFAELIFLLPLYLLGFCSPIVRVGVAFD
jgi:hypothetical protein